MFLKFVQLREVGNWKSLQQISVMCTSLENFTIELKFRALKFFFSVFRYNKWKTDKITQKIILGNILL